MLINARGFGLKSGTGIVSGARMAAQAMRQASGSAGWLAITAVVALAYFLVAQLGLSLSLTADKVTFVWPPSGLALAACLLFGWRALPGVVLGSLSTNLGYIIGIDKVDPVALVAAVGMSAGSVLQTVFATLLCRRWLCAPAVHDTNRAVARFVVVAAVSCCVAASLGVTSLSLRHLIDPASVTATWLIWWVGDAAGMLVVAPPLLWWLGAGRDGPEALAGVGAAAAVNNAEPQRPNINLAVFADSAFPVICMGAGLCLMSTMIVGHLERQYRLDQFHQEADTLVLALEKNLTLSLRDLQGLQSFYYKVDIAEDEFLATTRPLLGHHAWQRGFGWATWVRQGQRPSFEAGPVAAGPAGAAGMPLRDRDANGQLVVAAERPDYLALTHVSPAQVYGSLKGLDLLPLTREAGALRQALATGEPGALAARGLLADGSQRTALLLFWPVRAGALDASSAADQRPVRGASLVLVDAQELLAQTCAELRCKAHGLQLYDARRPDAPLVSLAGVDGQAMPSPAAPLAIAQAMVGTHARHELRINDLPLVLVQRAPSTGLPWPVNGLQLGVLLVGLGFTSVLGAYVAQRRRAEQVAISANLNLEHQVAQRTTELSGANAALQAEVRERQRAEDALRMFRWFADGADQALGIADFQRRVVYLNPAMRRFAGLAPDAVVEGTDLLDIYPAARRGQIVDQVWPLLQAGGQWTGELCLAEPRRLRDGGPELSHLIDSFFVLHDEAGAPQLVAGILTDISALKQLEAQVQRARAAAEGANQAKSAFLANMSHEIRTPLNAVLGYTQLMREDRTLAAAHRERLGSVLSAGQRLLGLINDILDLSKIEAGAMAVFARPFDLRAELQELADLMRGRALARRLSFAMTLDLPTPAHVLADQTKVGQMVLNLLGNAIKFTETGGVTLKVWHDGMALCFEVTDTGPGISDDELKTLFAPFRQGDSGQAKGGTGLGLSITRRLAQLMGGELSLASRTGQGTQALLRLPLPYTDLPVAPGPHQQRSTGQLRLVSPATLRVLVAEDDPDSSEVLASLLRQLGCTVTVCGHGAEALAALDAAGPGLGHAPQLVFTDIRMPVMNGLQLLAALRKRPGLAGLPVVAVSASSMEHQRAHFLAEGFDDFVGKPYAFEDIYRALERHTGATLAVPQPAPGTALAAAAPATTVALPVPAAADAPPQPLPALSAADRDTLTALLKASSSGAMGPCRRLLATFTPARLGPRQAAMAAALAGYDLETVERLAAQILAEDRPDLIDPTNTTERTRASSVALR